MHRSAPCLALLFALSPALISAPFLPPGHRPRPHDAHALVGGTVVVKPGTRLQNATVVIRDGLIEAVGADVQPPNDARVWDAKGATIYAGLIDPYFLAVSTGGDSRGSSAADARSETLTSGNINFFGVRGDETDKGDKGPGYMLSAINPDRRVEQGFAPDADDLKNMRSLGFTAANLAPSKGIFRGSGAFVFFKDANPNELILQSGVVQHLAFEQQGGEDRVYPGSLMGVIAAVRQTFLDARWHEQRWAAYRKQPVGNSRPEFNPALETLSLALSSKRAFMIEPRSPLMIDRAGRLAREFGLNAILVATGEEWRRPNLLAKAAKRYVVPVNFPTIPKMPTDDAWENIPLDRLREWDWAAENPALLKRNGAQIAFTTFDLSNKKDFRKNLGQAIERGLREEDALAALTTAPAGYFGVADRLGTVEKGKIANLTIVNGKSYFDPESKIREVWIEGQIHPVETPKLTAESKTPDKPAPGKKLDAKQKEAGDKAKADAAKKKKDLADIRKKRAAKPPLSGRGVLASPKSILVKNATVWTCGPDGRLLHASLLIRNGRIEQVGQFDAQPDADTLVIDAEGKHVTPGLIDCHSHSMILGGVNEGTLPSTAMVRVQDVVSADTSNIYRQLAGGLTVANLLHGSANPIGGQNCVIKLRDGENPEGLKFKEAPAGIKFALGENVKQSNWGDKYTTRFPQTRMGVRTFFVNRFTAAKQYLQDWREYREHGGIPPRRDLELEALGEIIEGKRWIHCHSYRQDEILVFLRAMEEFGVKVGTLQHVLEGYKVADEIAKHGAGASAFSDWWAYKFEVYDAVPYAGALMRERGVLVSFNSDSSDLARRMNLEAAKAVKYGGVPEEEALRFVTLNPAKQLRIDKRVGSLEKGKDADFVIWTDHPLSTRSVCEQTWIEGKKYFDRASDEKRTAALETEKKALIAKAKKIADGGKGKPEDKKTKADAARAALFQRALKTMHDIDGSYSCCDRHRFGGVLE